MASRRFPDATLMARFIDVDRTPVRATASRCRRCCRHPVRSAGLRRAGARDRGSGPGGRGPGDDRLLALRDERLGLVSVLGRPARLLAQLPRLAPALGGAALAVLSVMGTARRVG